MGLEPMISRTTIWRANQLHHTHHITYRTVFCPTKYHRIKFSTKRKKMQTQFIQDLHLLNHEASGIRTPDNLIKSQVLYHLS